MLLSKEWWSLHKAIASGLEMVFDLKKNVHVEEYTFWLTGRLEEYPTWLRGEDVEEYIIKRKENLDYF